MDTPRQHLIEAAHSNMTPTLQMGDGFLVDRTLRPNRWNIVTYRLSTDPGVTRVSRLIGLPGDVTELRDGEVFRNGAMLPKPTHLANLHYTSVGRCSGCTGKIEA